MISKKYLFRIAAIAVCLVPSIALTQVNEQQLTTLDTASAKALIAHSGAQPIQLDLLWFRSDPSVLNDPRYMRYFIMVNNCSNSKIGSIEKALDSEFDYPMMVEFYKKHETEIFQSLPDSLSAMLRQVYPDPRPPHLASNIDLGEYDASTGTFPIVDSNNKKLTVDLESFTVGGRGFSCGSLSHVDTRFPFAYYITFPKVSFTQFKIDEAAARKYVSSPGVGAAGMGRTVSLLIEVDLLPNPHASPVMSQGRPDPNRGPEITFPAKLKRVAVLDFYRHELGTLYP